MPAQVDGNTVEILSIPSQLGRIEGEATEVLWGTPGTIPTQASDTHAQVVEALTVPAARGHIMGEAAEALWLDLTFQVEIEGEAAEVLWGTPATLNAQVSDTHARAIEVLTTAQNLADLSANQVELFVTYNVAIAAVSDIVGPPAILATFDGTTSLGFITQYRWNWVSVPGGSLISNASLPYPNFGGTTPIDMTSNAVLYHAEETVGVTGADTSGSGNTANLTAITVGVGGQVGSYSWDYTGGTSVAAPTVPVAVGSSWTIAFWFFNLAPNTAFRSGARGTSEVHVAVEISGDRVGVFASGAFRPTDTGFTMTTGAFTGWHQIVAVGKSTGDTTIYVDGAAVGTVVGFRPAITVTGLGNSLAGSQRFADRLDEVAIWTRELTAIEILDIYTLQSGNFAGVGPMFPFLPDEEGTYTVNLTVVDGLNGGITVDTADAVISGRAIKFPMQGDSLRMWAHLQGQLLRQRDES
jgi:hypothetical protein